MRINNTREFDLGESRYIDYEVRPKNVGDTIVISTATWQLLKGAVVESSGSCTVDGTTVSALIEPETVGTYTLAVTVTVPPETIIEKCVIVVT